MSPKEFSDNSNNTQDNMLLDEVSIANRRISVEKSEIKITKNGNFICHFCSKRFKSEALFMKHNCEQKRRHQELYSPLGQAAYGYYREWMKAKKFKEQSSAAFLDSRYYRSFINFAKMVQAANISNPELYIHLMVSADIQPPLWCRDSTYSIYLEYIDKQSDPLDEVQCSVEYLITLAEKDNIQLENIFDHLGSQKILSLIRQRRLSPWFLFQSKKFASMLKSLSKDELKAFNIVVNASFWAKRFQENKDIVEQIKIIVNELGL